MVQKSCSNQQHLIAPRGSVDGQLVDALFGSRQQEYFSIVKDAVHMYLKKPDSGNFRCGSRGTLGCGGSVASWRGCRSMSSPAQ